MALSVAIIITATSGNIFDTGAPSSSGASLFSGTAVSSGAILGITSRASRIRSDTSPGPRTVSGHLRRSAGIAKIGGGSCGKNLTIGTATGAVDAGGLGGCSVEEKKDCE